MAHLWLPVAALLMVQAVPSDELGARFSIWKEGRRPESFVPAGLMPDGDGIKLKTDSEHAPHTSPYCVHAECDLTDADWVGVYFVPKDAKPWLPRLHVDLFARLHAKPGDDVRCRFWARSANSAVVVFQVGGLNKDGRPLESIAKARTLRVKLHPQWRRYEINLKDADISRISGAFAWTVSWDDNQKDKVAFDLDTVYYVRVASAQPTTLNKP